jgi:hypothetical protein
MTKTRYKVYEINDTYRQHGKLLKSFSRQQDAEKFTSKSIYRYIKEDVMIDLAVGM